MNETAAARRRKPAPEPVLALQNVYLKDCSYESPNGPRMEGNWNPQINLDLQTGSTALGRRGARGGADGDRVGEARRGNDVPGRGEAGGPVRDPQPLGETTPSARSALTARGCSFPMRAPRSSQLVSQGGFPQFLLPPVNFERSMPRNLSSPAQTDQLRGRGAVMHSRRSGRASRSPCSARAPGARRSPSSSRAAAAPCGCGAAMRAQLAAMARERRNARYLPGDAFPASLAVERELAAALARRARRAGRGAELGLRSLLSELAPYLSAEHAPGLGDQGIRAADSGCCRIRSHARCSAPSASGAVLSGPTFAREVGAGLPTAMTIASPDAAYAKQLAAELSSANFRAYTSTDILGVEIGGAVKNVLAVGAGLSDGLGFGANTRVALITRGLKEMTRLGVALGARAETFMGLAGLGDLVLTCTDDQSRNRRFGLLLASGLPRRGARRDRPGGGGLCRRAGDARRRRARAGGDAAVRMAYRVLYEGLAPQEAVRALMSRPIRAEEG